MPLDAVMGRRFGELARRSHKEWIATQPVANRLALNFCGGEYIAGRSNGYNRRDPHGPWRDIYLIGTLMFVCKIVSRVFSFAVDDEADA